jgi:hypothetical protein
MQVTRGLQNWGQTEAVFQVFVFQFGFISLQATGASKKNQVLWTGMQLQFVKLGAAGNYESVDLNSTVEFTLTSEF